MPEQNLAKTILTGRLKSDLTKSDEIQLGDYS